MGAAIKAGLAKIAGVIGGGASAVWAAIQGAGLVGLLKIGLIAGVSIAVIVLIFKFLKNKWNMYTNKKNQTVTDAALERNYADVREQEKLHPLMNDVKRSLRKDLNPKKKGKKSEFERYHRKHCSRSNSDSTMSKEEERRILNKYFDFKRNYRPNDGRVTDEEMDRCSLRRIWNFI